MEITSFALFGWSMALASILFFIFIYKKVRRTTATGAGLRNNDGSADPDVKIVGQDEKYKRATWGISTELQTTRQPTSRPLHHTAPHLSPWKLTDGFTPSPPASPTITEEAQMPWTIMTKTCTIFSQSHNLTKYSANSPRRAFISQSEEQSQLHFTRKQNDIRGKSNGVGIFLIKYL